MQIFLKLEFGICIERQVISDHNSMRFIAVFAPYSADIYAESYTDTEGSAEGI
jgi:hypothetical protein